MVSYNELSNIPLTFTPSSHNHVKADITDFAHNHIKADITDFAHNHLKADITDFAHNHLKADITDFAHNHVKADITDFAHNHVKADITDFSHTHLKADITDFAHNHVKADITDFAHNHLKADITDFAHTLDSHSNVIITTPTAGDYLYYTGSNWINRAFLYASLRNTANVTQALGNGADTLVNGLGSISNNVLVTNDGTNMNLNIASNAGTDRLSVIHAQITCSISNNSTLILKIKKNNISLNEYTFNSMSNGVSELLILNVITNLSANDLIQVFLNAGTNTTLTCLNNHMVINITEL
jgi:hypothetical protein